MPAVLKNLMARLKRRRKLLLSRTKSETLEAPVKEMQELSLSSQPDVASEEGMQSTHVFGKKPLAFSFDPAAFVTDSAIAWPGPSYDNRALFAPGIFDKPRHYKRSSNMRKPSKRTLSQDERYTARSKPPLRNEQKEIAARSKKKQPAARQTSRPGFFGNPPAQDPLLHLLDLPGEIRNEIYRLLYVQEEPIIAHFRRVMKPKNGRSTSIRRFPREPALALVCKQLHHEAMFVFYSENTFIFRTRNSPALSGAESLANMTRKENIEKWAPRFGFADFLTSIQTEMKLRDERFEQHVLTYRLEVVPVEKAKYKPTFSADLTTMAGGCVCVENAIKARVEKSLESAVETENLLTLLARLRDLRSLEYCGALSKKNVEDPFQYHKFQNCGDCGLPHLRESGTGT